RPAPFRAEDQVNNEVASRVRQVSFAPSELAVLRFRSPRLAPWAAFLRRFAARLILHDEEGRGGDSSHSQPGRISALPQPVKSCPFKTGLGRASMPVSPRALQ